MKKSGSQIEDQEYQTQSPESGLKTGWYDRGMKDRGMKEKTSITLSQAVLKGIDRIAASKKGSKPSRSALIEAVLADLVRSACAQTHFNFSYSARAAFSTGKSASASFHAAKKSW